MVTFPPASPIQPINDRPGYINVDELQAQMTLAEAAAKCGVTLDTQGQGKEVRIDCPFNCPGDHAGRREVSINTENPQKVFLCHAYTCKFRGNLLTLMHGFLTGQRPTGDRLKGDEFSRVKKVLAGDASAPIHTKAPKPASPPVEPQRVPNSPLTRSENEKARELVKLDDKFIVDVSAMNPAAASYVRRHPSLSPESMKKWRAGYLPQDGGGDKRGWSLRGQIIYPILAEDGQVLSWAARDPLFEQKEQAFSALSAEQRAKEKPPHKHKFPAGFQRGLELFGQHGSRLQEPGYREFIAAHGIVVVEGFNDVIGLDNLGIPAVGIMSNRMTESQVEKIARWAKALSGGKIVLLFDADAAGDEGAKEALWLFAQRHLNVQLGWTSGMHGGQFVGRQPESLERTAWDQIVVAACVES